MNGWGGRREGAGRKRKGGLRRAGHSKRGAFRDLAPVHVTTRIVRGLPTLRSLRAARALKAAFLAGRERGDFRLIHFSVMSNHLHLIVEADDSRALTRGVQGLLVRIARHLNSALRRTGRVFADRFHFYEEDGQVKGSFVPLAWMVWSEARPASRGRWSSSSAGSGQTSIRNRARFARCKLGSDESRVLQSPRTPSTAGKWKHAVTRTLRRIL